MFFMEGTQKKMKLSRKVITHQSFTSFFVDEIKNNWLPITKSFSILIIDKVNVCICLFYFQVGWEGEGWIEGDST